MKAEEGGIKEEKPKGEGEGGAKREGEKKIGGRGRGKSIGGLLFIVYCLGLVAFCWWLGKAVKREGLWGGEEVGGGKRTEDKTYRVEVSLEDVFDEQILGFEGERIEICDECDGLGVTQYDPPPCPACEGRGVQYRTVRLSQYQSFKTEERCSSCHGTGIDPQYICPVCHGHRHVRNTVQFTVPIPAGLQDGQVVVLEGESDEYVDHESGDVRVVLFIKKHPFFERDGENLVTNLTISLKEALLGFARTITHLDGRAVDVQSMEVTGPGDELVVKGMGLLKEEGGRGDLRVRAKIDYQKNRKFSLEQKEELVRLLGEKMEK